MVRTGLEQLIINVSPQLLGKRLGLASHPAAVLPDLTGAVDALQAAGYNLEALFGPEHGFSGASADGAQIADAIDPRTGLPVYSLYGAQKEPSEQALSQIDALVFDMQDVGVRFYTYLSTLYYILRGAGKAGKPVFVLDRPNPITGSIIEGGAVEPGLESFVGVINIPMRHGMTLGELANYINTEFGFGTELHVIAMQNWQRQMWFDETGLPWVPTSPAMPHVLTTILYPGMCLLEGTNFSLGRGTSLPFELCGAPWLDGYRLAQEMNALDLPGVRFRPISFTPSASIHSGSECQGVQVHITDRNKLRPVEMALNLIATARCMSVGHFSWNPHFQRLAGSADLHSKLESGMPVSQITAEMADFITNFKDRRQKYLLYK